MDEDKALEYSISYSIGDSPTTPAIKTPYFEDFIVADTMKLNVYNSYDINYDTLMYEFELYDTDDLLLDEPIYSINIAKEDGGETVWEVGNIDSNTYFWRCRARDENDNYSAWTNSIAFTYKNSLISSDDTIGCFINTVR